MNKIYNVIIVSKNDFNDLDVKELNYKVIKDSCLIIDNNSLKVNNEVIFFDYLIIQDKLLITNLRVETDSKLAITNAALQTSIENFFAISPFNHCTKSLEEQLDIILDYIHNPY